MVWRLCNCRKLEQPSVNESFADFSESIWAEYKYGKDAGDAHSYDAMVSYLSQPDAKTKNLIRFNYEDKEDMFDVVTYQKGGRILYMLRNYLGNAAFYKGLNIYLKTNALKNGEAQQLRLAMEEASGRDLNWFFNQWYFGAGHPILNISYKWDDATKTQTVYLSQSQDGNAFILPMAIDIYAGGKKQRHNYWMRNKIDSVSYKLAAKPSLVNVDGDKALLTKKTDNKSLEEFVFQYFNAPLYLDRSEALAAAVKKQTDAGARKVIIAALKDKYYPLRIKAINNADLTNDDVRNAAQPILASLAQTDENTLVRAAAITALGKLKASGNTNLFKQSLNSESYAVQGAALSALGQLNPADAVALAKTYEKDSQGALKEAVLNVYATAGTDDQWPYVYNAFKEGAPQTQFNLMKKFADFAGRVKNPEYEQQGITTIGDFGAKYKKYGVAPQITAILADIKAQRTKLNDTTSTAAVDKALSNIEKAQ